MRVGEGGGRLTGGAVVWMDVHPMWAVGLMTPRGKRERHVRPEKTGRPEAEMQ